LHHAGAAKSLVQPADLDGLPFVSFDPESFTGQRVAAMIAEQRARIVQGAADGFNLTPTHLPHGIEDFVELVVPELRRRGLFRGEYESTTLRGNLGLTDRINRYTTERQRAALAGE
jgi:hypothetical protein